LNLRTDERFDITFRPPDTSPCPVRGVARAPEGSRPAEAAILAGEQTSRAQILGVLAHEVAHLFHFVAFQAGHPNVSLSEGLATWAAGTYWETWQKKTPSEVVRSLQQERRYLPLSDHFNHDWSRDRQSPDCVAERELRYSSVAAFLDFLITNYGIEKLQELMGPAEPRPGPLTLPTSLTDEIIAIRTAPQFARVPPRVVSSRMNFLGVYGRTLEELEKSWLEQLSQAK
jgi:hypothetical protein